MQLGQILSANHFPCSGLGVLDHPKTWVHNFRKLRRMAKGMHDEGVAEMKNRLLTKTETADGAGIIALRAVGKGQDAATIPLGKHAIVGHQQAGHPQKRVIRLRPALMCNKSDHTSLRILGVLDKFLEHRKARGIPVFKVCLDLPEYGTRRGSQIGHGFLEFGDTTQICEGIIERIGGE